MKELVVNLLEKAIKEKKVKMTKEEIIRFLVVPPSMDMGDYAFPCFSIGEKLKVSPHQAALELREKIGNPPATDFEDITVEGPYLNFTFNRKELARKIVWDAITKEHNYGKSKIGKKKKILIEFSSPNIAKPFGIGHLRSTIIGNSLANIAEFLGYKTLRMNYLGDWGTQFGKLLLGYERAGDEKKLEKDPIKHLLELYVKANKKSDEPKAREWFKKMEDRDRTAISLWRAFKELSLDNFQEFYNMMGIKFDDYDAESNHNGEMGKIIEELEKKKLLKKSQGALIVDLSQYNLGVVLIQKSDGATLYATRDLAAAIDRYNKYKFHKMIYEVGQEQSLYFKQLFKILELMGYKWAKDCVHVEHGLYLAADGKRFATRKGKTVFMEEIINQTKELAKKEIKKRLGRINKGELEERSTKIALAAIFYGDLKNNRKNNVVFDLKKFVSFEGNTGPYILYSYARASSIMRKIGRSKEEKFKILNLHEKELDLIQKLLLFEETVVASFNSLNPSLIAHYAYQTSKLFNEFYHVCPVIDSKEEAFRIALVEAFRIVIKNSLHLLGIEPLEEM